MYTVVNGHEFILCTTTALHIISQWFSTFFGPWPLCQASRPPVAPHVLPPKNKVNSPSRVWGTVPATNDFWTFYAQSFAILRIFGAFWKLTVTDNNTKNTRKYNWCW